PFPLVYAIGISKSVSTNAVSAGAGRSHRYHGVSGIRTPSTYTFAFCTLLRFRFARRRSFTPLFLASILTLKVLDPVKNLPSSVVGYGSPRSHRSYEEIVVADPVSPEIT